MSKNNFGNYINPTIYHAIDHNIIKCVWECGACDATDTIELQRCFKDAEIIAFECNPECFQVCKKTLEDYPKIKLFERGLWNKTGTEIFQQVDRSKSRFNSRWDEFDGNWGASSFFEINNDARGDEYVQNPIEVNTIRGEDVGKEFNIPYPDLLCLDAEGSEINILEGFGESLSHVKYVITESTASPLWEKGPTHPEIESYLLNHGFMQEYSSSPTPTQINHLMYRRIKL